MLLRTSVLAVIVTLAFGAGLAPHASAAVPPDACERIARAARDFSGRLAYVLVDLDSGGGSCGQHADAEFVTASLYKLFVLAAAYQERERGTLSFAEPLTVPVDAAADDPPELRVERAPQVTVAEAVRLMVQVSDNPSAAALRERLGADTIAAMPVRLGLHDTHLGEQFTTTAGDIGGFFALLHEGRVVSPGASREMAGVLQGEFFTAGLADGMPAGTPFAHKVGYLAGLAHDGGIVTTVGGAYVLVVMSEADEARGEVIEVEASGGTREQRPVYDLRPAFDVMESIAAVAFSAYTNRPLPPSGSFGDPDGPARWGADAGLLGWWPVVLVAVLGGGAVVLRRRSRGRHLIADDPRAWPAADLDLLPLPRPVAGDVQRGEEALASLDRIAMVDGYAEADPEAVFEVASEPSVEVPKEGRDAARITRDDGYTARQDTQFAPRVLATRRDPTMRFGSRNNHNDDAERAERVEVRQEMRAPRPAPARAPLPPVTSARLRRIAEYFVAQEELLHEMQRQVEMETAPLAELLVRQQTTMQQTMANLDDRLRPLNEYADAEEANLGALEQRMAGAGMDFVARSFAEYLATQRERIAETRTHIDEQRAPFLRYDEDARGVVEIALSRFDDDLGARSRTCRSSVA